MAGSDDEVLDLREAATLPGQRETGQPPDDQQDLDRLLAAQPSEPPTPAEQTARDENDALGGR